MNPQPHPIVGQFGVLIFALLTAYFCFTGKRKDIQLSDKFTIGYIDDDIPCVVQPISTSPRKTNTTTKTNKTSTNKNKIPQSLLTPVKEVDPINEELFEDCILALVSLGTKKTQAKRITQEVFENHNPKTIEDFIKFVYVK